MWSFSTSWPPLEHHDDSPAEPERRQAMTPGRATAARESPPQSVTTVTVTARQLPAAAAGPPGDGSYWPRQTRTRTSPSLRPCPSRSRWRRNTGLDGRAAPPTDTPIVPPMLQGDAALATPGLPRGPSGIPGRPSPTRTTRVRPSPGGWDPHRPRAGSDFLPSSSRPPGPTATVEGAPQPRPPTGRTPAGHAARPRKGVGAGASSQLCHPSESSKTAAPLPAGLFRRNLKPGLDSD
jgi:hypothetical protein